MDSSLDTKSSREKAPSQKIKKETWEDCLSASQLLTCFFVCFLRFDLSSSLILAYHSSAVSLILPYTCVYMFMFVLSLLLDGTLSMADSLSSTL